jgi:mannan endo-1,4-beta-mannosidase
LYKIKGKKIISGHHNYSHNAEEFTQRAFDITKEYPAIWGSDFIVFDTSYRQNVVNEAIRKFKQGYIITLMWHAARPFDTLPYRWKENIQGEVSKEEWNQILTPNTELHQKWQTQVDEVAEYLKQLQKANIPILWRPYHEMNGIWFWWGDKKGEDGFIKLWKMLYDRMVNYHHLDNLLWVWNTNTPRDLENDEAYPYKDFFPGVDYVDVLATDVYHNDYKQSHHDELVELGQGKLMALGEVGEVPTPEILTNQPQWAWFMIWANWVDKANTPEKIQALYQFKKVLNKNEVKIKW